MHACICLAMIWQCINLIPYSQKYWLELNLAVGPQIAIVKILVDLNLVVW